MKLVSVNEMREIEKEANEKGLTYEQMMENAGYNLAQEILILTSQIKEDEDVQVIGLVGPGNNGGDTLVALARLAEKGMGTRAYLIKRKSAGDPLAKRLEAAGGEIYHAEDDIDFYQLHAFLETADILLDGVLGTGFELPLKADVAKILAATRDTFRTSETTPYIIAVDCPSGVNCDSGEISTETLRADETITMAAIKQGLLKLPANDFCGNIKVAGTGDLSALKTWQGVVDYVADEALISSFLPDRPRDAHKGTFGTAIVTAGSLNYTGAGLLAGRAAARVGTGLVTLAVPSPLHTVLAGHFPEATWILLPHEMGVISADAADVLKDNISRATVMLLGPGLGREETTKEFIEKLLTDKSPKATSTRRIGFIQDASINATAEDQSFFPPMVVDADGLKHLVNINRWQELLPAPAILTPHPGEMAILTGLPLDVIQTQRLYHAKKYANAWGHIVVLKGAFTVIAAPDGRTTTIPIATSALSHAGTGDVLAGLITGLRAQGVEAYKAAVAGAWIHARAAQLGSETLGSTASILAGDLLDWVVDIMGEFQIEKK